MKVQIDVDSQLWREVKSRAAFLGETLIEYVGNALNSHVGREGKNGGEKKLDVPVVARVGAAKKSEVANVPRDEAKEPVTMSSLAKSGAYGG